MEQCELAVDSCNLMPLYSNRLAGTPINGGIFDNWGVVLQADESFELPISLELPESGWTISLWAWIDRNSTIPCRTCVEGEEGGGILCV